MFAADNNSIQSFPFKTCTFVCWPSHIMNAIVLQVAHKLIYLPHCSCDSCVSTHSTWWLLVCRLGCVCTHCKQTTTLMLLLLLLSMWEQLVTGAAQPGVGLLATGMVQRSLGMRVLYIYIYIIIRTLSIIYIYIYTYIHSVQETLEMGNWGSTWEKAKAGDA